MKIFWSWQSDNEQKVCRFFMRDVLRAVTVELNQEADEANRENEETIEIDHDTSGIAGSPPIAETILNKIREAAVFVADVTPIAKTGQEKYVANPNVMIELGFALSAIGHERIVLVMNNAFFDANLQSLPFDLRHWRGPITYCLPADASKELRKEEGVKLRGELKRRLQPCLDAAIRQLEEESNRMAPAVPKFTAQILGVGGELTTEINQSVGELGVDSLEEIKKMHPILSFEERERLNAKREELRFSIDIMNRPPDFNPERNEIHNRRLEHYYRSYDEYLSQVSEYKKRLLRTVKVKMVLSNVGRAPGVDIDVIVKIPKGLTLLKDGEAIPAPARPEIPELDPTTRISYRNQFSSFDSAVERRGDSWTEVDREKNELQFHVGYLKHWNEFSSDTFSLSFISEDDIGPIQFAYTIIASELPDPYFDVITLDFSKSSG